MREEPARVPTPRLARHRVELDDGHVVSVAVAGKGVPFVVAHGFMAEGFMYAQTLSRLVALGYKVVAIDTAGHGGTDVLPEGERDFASYVDVLRRSLDQLGIDRAVLTGHSMGGRIVAQLAAEDPKRAIALVLVDPILGAPWDRIVSRARSFPPLLVWLGAVILGDTLATIPLLRDRAQARKFVRLLVPTVLKDVRRPWRWLAPTVAILRSEPTTAILDRLRKKRVPTTIVHGERDIVVPLATARDAADRAGGELIVVHDATHSWLLKDPETLPAVVMALADGAVGDATADALRAAGLDPDTATVDEVEATLYRRDALVLALTPALEFELSGYEHRPARYAFSKIEQEAV